MPDKNGVLLPGDEGYVAPIEETTETADPVEAEMPNQVVDPFVEPEIITEQETIADPSVEQAPDVVEIPEPEIISKEEAYNKQEPSPNPELYTVQAADLNTYPELSQQGVQLYDQVRYGSLYVWKKATADGNGVAQEAWPRSIGSEKANGITFKGE